MILATFLPAEVILMIIEEYLDSIRTPSQDAHESSRCKSHLPLPLFEFDLSCETGLRLRGDNGSVARLFLSKWSAEMTLRGVYKRSRLFVYTAVGSTRPSRPCQCVYGFENFMEELPMCGRYIPELMLTLYISSGNR